MRRTLVSAMVLTALAIPAAGQTPQPFPRAGTAKPAPVAPAAGSAAGAEQAPAPVTAGPNAPSAATVGFPIYPGAEYLASYDAGKGQRYYLYGSTTPYAELVKWYQTQLRDRGDQVYPEPATHMFSQRFREETMVFPPGVTVKDWTSGGSQGYPNPRPGAEPARFPAVIMIVPPLPANR